MTGSDIRQLRSFYAAANEVTQPAARPSRSSPRAVRRGGSAGSPRRPGEVSWVNTGAISEAGNIGSRQHQGDDVPRPRSLSREWARFGERDRESARNVGACVAALGISSGCGSRPLRERASRRIAEAQSTLRVGHGRVKRRSCRSPAGKSLRWVGTEVSTSERAPSPAAIAIIAMTSRSFTTNERARNSTPCPRRSPSSR